MKRAFYVSLMGVALVFALFGMQANPNPNVVAVTLERAKSLPEEPRPKLSPQLNVVMDLNATLKGISPKGQLILGVSAEALEAAKTSPTGYSLAEELPPDWTPATRLKLSYQPTNKPAKAKLEALSLKVVDDYVKGSFMEVELITGEIDFQLLGKLREMNEIRYVTLVQKSKSI